MKKLFIAMLCLVSLVCQAQQPIETKKNITTINSTTIASDITGYHGTTPLLVTLRNGKIQSVEALPNQETPNYFAMVSAVLLKKWNGMTPQQALDADVDMVSGASYSSYSVIETLRATMRYYIENSK